MICPKCDIPMFWNSYFQRFMCSGCGYEQEKEQEVHKIGSNPAAKMYVTMKVEGRFVVEVDTDNIEEAKKLANEAFMEANFGELSDIDAEAIIVENEEGDYIWEK